MTVLLVLFTLILFLTADYFVQRARLAKAGERLRPLIPQSVNVPSDVRLAPNHTWVKFDKDGNIVLGVDELLARLIGPIERIVLPATNAEIVSASPSITLRHGQCKLSLASPVHGRVVETNRNAAAHPELMRRDPYGEGWLLRIQPGYSNDRIDRMLLGDHGREWLKREVERIKEFFLSQSSPAQLATMQDGGFPADGLLQQFDAGVWNEFQRSFASLATIANTSMAEI